MPAFRWYGMPLPQKKSLTNGGRRGPGHQKQNLWILKWVVVGFMLWWAPKDKRVGQSKNILRLAQKPILKCITPLQTKMKTPNCRVLIGILILVNKSEYSY